MMNKDTFIDEAESTAGLLSFLMKMGYTEEEAQEVIDSLPQAEELV